MSAALPDDHAMTLVVEGLNVRRGEASVLHDVSLSVRPSTVTALLGRNGAGKTTTLLGILGLLPAQGRITLADDRIDGLPVHLRAQAGIGYVPEDREVFSDLTVEENLRLAIRGDSDPSRLEVVRSLFPMLTERRGQKAGSLSGGQQQMLAIARALVNENRLLLVDEPSKGLAPSVVADVITGLRAVGGGTSMLLVEQNLAVAEALADEAVVLDEGRVVYVGRMADLANDHDATRRWLGVEVLPREGRH